MAYKYKHFIPQNIAPSGATSIGAYDGSGNKICSIALGRLTPPNKEKLYSFGLLSDIHLADYRQTSYTKFDNALSYFEEQGVSFCCHSGDLTDYGFWYPTATYRVSYYNPVLFEEYQSICENHNIPVYGCCGNHESYNGYDITGTYTDEHGADPSLVVNNLEKLQEYTGKGLYFALTQGNDVFIFLGQPSGNIPMSDEALQWLYETLENNRNKRCFIFVHPHISSGNPVGAYKSNPLFKNWEHFSAFKNLLSHYKNTILFHGHTHFKFECQEQDKESTYSTKDGFRSVHVPSSSTPRDVVDGELVNRNDESQGYIVDVYDDCIVLNGMDFINNRYVAIGVFKIDTTLQTIDAGTFTDSTGTIEI